jgi:hypothetical protein
VLHRLGSHRRSEHAMALKAVLGARPNILVVWDGDGIYDQTVADTLKPLVKN